MPANLIRPIFSRVRRTSPLLLIRMAVIGILLFPVWSINLILSLIRAAKWQNPEVCKEFVRENRLAFANELDENTIEVKRISGGLSNLNESWSFKTKAGAHAEYFVKVFLPLGSLWAIVNALASPFPYRKKRTRYHRFIADLASRAVMTERGIPVAKLVAFDSDEKVMVTELLEGESLDRILRKMAESKAMLEEEKHLLAECGAGLGQIHASGFSLVDTQPVNCIWVPSRGRVYFIDLEFSTHEDFRSWDVGFFLAFLAARLPEAMAKEASRLFLEGYARNRPVANAEIRAISEELKKYLPVFETILDLRDFNPAVFLDFFS